MQKDKIKGCLFGYAIGDALGLGAEFMSRQEVSVRYPDGLTTYEQIIRDAHRSQWERGDYTNDTTLLLLMIDSIVSKGTNDCIDLAHRMKNWFEETKPLDISSNLRWVLSYPGYLDDPRKVALTVFKNHHSVISRNDSLGRCMIAGLWPEFDEEMIVDNISITHSHPMTIACGVCVAKIANDLFMLDKMTDFETLYEISEKYNGNLNLFLQIAQSDSLEELELDDPESANSAAKALTATVWALNHFDNPTDMLFTLLKEGGDTDSICALATGLAGLRYGFHSLPSHLVDGLRNYDTIQKASDRLASVLNSAIKNESVD